ncbi:RHS repeat protein [Escherichia coli]|nr:RHS repeat-associated core domain-containing protein [Escherichia coli]EFA1206761.1 RHS repeat protein [Escherichia coli]EFL7399335.1 RHS repeat protein [Escherichia coli]EMB9957709.1 RHS repeat protein [Escherichia coli]MBW9469404.1 RHS repeat protein [Escherichia coli]MBW9601089.1 RHS repeat protein [Escherichia coli]
MSGKPAARQGDMTQYGGSIVQGSAGVRIGAPTGVACSVCPGGVTSGHPVNPLLGAKVLPGETDIALPGPLPFILSRTYSSYRTKTPAPVGSLGPGWKMPADIRLQLRDNTLILSDNGGRSLYFEHLFPGEDGYSRSESLWLVRGGVAKLDEGHRLAALWQALPEELRLSPHRYLATNSPQGPWWLLGWCERVTDISHISEGHRVTVHYGYDSKGRLASEHLTVHHPQTNELLWQHETRHAYNAQGLANRCIPDSLPAVEWLTYGSGWLSGMKLGDTPLVEYTRDRLHRETLRSFGRYELTTAYTPAGQLQSQHLNSLLSDRDYTWNDNGELIRISSPRQTRSYSYSTTGRLTGVHTTAANLDIRIPYTTDPAGNRLPDPELHPDSALSMWPDNRIARDAHYLYRYDRHGRLTEKTDLIPEGVIRTDDERTHRYHYDSQHRLVHYTRTQYAEPLVESRYLYDPLGRRVAKRVWRRERDLTGWMSLSRKPQVTWYGWDGDRLTTIQNDRTRIQTIYQPGSFTPLIRVETATGELAKTQRRSLADTLQQSGGEDGGSVVFPPVLVQMLDRLESEILADRVSEESRRWLASCGLTVAQMQSQMDPVYTPARKIHLYHCDHRGLPLALISTEGTTAWYAEYDEWGNLLNEENPHQLQQLIRLPGQQYDEESGLYYNRHRYYDPLQGRYITQDPIGLKGGWNFYQYPLNPISNIDPLGLETLKCIKPLHSMGGTGERSGPDIWGNPFYHQYLCVPDGKGDYTCGGQDQRGESKGDGLWGPGKASNDTKEAAGRCDLVETDNSCVENCLKGKFKEVRPRYSVLPDIFTPINLGLFKNCQDWSNDSLETCKMKCSGNNIGRFIRFVFTGVM